MRKRFETRCTQRLKRESIKAQPASQQDPRQSVPEDPHFHHVSHPFRTTSCSSGLFVAEEKLRIRGVKRTPGEVIRTGLRSR